MSTELVSIIMPVYNSENYLRQACDSIISQDYPHWRCYLVDDCSTDSSTHIIQEYLVKEKRFSLLATEQQSGPAIARNLAIKHAQGRYLCFLDSDDYWYTNKLSRQLTLAQANQWAICYSSFDRVNQQGQLIRYQPTIATTDYKRTLYNNLLNTCSVMIDTKQLPKIEFPIQLGHEDLGLWLHLLKKVPLAYGIDEPLLAYRVHKNSRNISIIRRFNNQWQIYLQYEKMPFLAALYYFSKHTFHGFAKRRLEGLVRDNTH